MDSPFLGMVQYYAFDFAPRGWANCDGSLLPIAQNAALFSLLGTTYGGNGVNTFALPDLRGRAVTGMGNSFTIGERYGTETATLLTTNMPSHTHTVPSLPIATNTSTGRGTGGNATDPHNNYFSNVVNANMYAAAPSSGANLAGASVVVGPAGNNLPFSTRNPYLALTCCISMTGIFPSRN